MSRPFDFMGLLRKLWEMGVARVRFDVDLNALFIRNDPSAWRVTSDNTETSSNIAGLALAELVAEEKRRKGIT